MSTENQIPKVIQIEISRASDFFNGSSETVIALCEDGSIWRLVREKYGVKHYWHPITLEKEERR